MNPAGVLIVFAANLIPLVWYLPLAAQHGSSAIASLYIGSVALISMGLSQLFATRFQWLENIFGGLDKIYVLHKWLGITAIVAILLHDNIGAEIKGLGPESSLTDLAENFGEISLYGLIGLVVISLLMFIPYHWWRWTHKFMGALFALSAFHYLFMLKPFAVTDPLGIYVALFCLLGVASYIYTLFPFEKMQARSQYTVSSVQPSGDAFAIDLKPEGKGISHRAGQFVFVRFDSAEDNETHPFTISKAPAANKSLRFTIKPLGDDTTRLVRNLELGTPASVSAAFGRFTRTNNQRPEIWLAGGVGVTPFAAFAKELPDESGPIHFFYSVSNRSNAAHLEEFEQLSQSNTNFNFHLIETSIEGRLTGQKIMETAGTELKGSVAYFCGPADMRENLKKDLVAAGLKSRNFRYEEFEIRSGIGLDQALSYLGKTVIIPIFNRLTSRKNKQA